MSFKVALLALSLSLLGLGAAQECEGVVGVLGMTPDQLKKEIRATVAAALNHSVNLSSGNGTNLHVVLSQNGVNSTLEKAVDVVIAKRLATAVEEVITNLSSSFEQLTSPIITQLNKNNANVQAIMTQLQHLHLPGSTPSHPAVSCKEIKELSPTAPSGYYWLRGTGDSSVHMYCDMSRSCGGITGGWMPAAKINMTNSNETCPEGLKLLTTPKRLCAMNIDEGGCSSATFNLHGIQYTHVCGKIIGYQQGPPDAFGPYYHNHRLTIDDLYVDGISLTHGHDPRKHIWTFAVAIHEVLTTDREHICPCTNIHNPLSIPIPPYVGSDYFCDTASESQFQFRFYPDDPLWDGQGCGRLNTCCSFNNPPWFMKKLPSPTSDDIEMRLCADQSRDDEDINFETIELYVH